MSFKVGDKVRVKGAERVGRIKGFDDCGRWYAEFESLSGGVCLWGEWQAGSLGIELELVEAALPEEPPVGTVIKTATLLLERWPDGRWYTTNSKEHIRWAGIVRLFGTNPTVLGDEKEVIREVLDWVDDSEYGKHSSIIRARRHFGVSLDD